MNARTIAAVGGIFMIGAAATAQDAKKELPLIYRQVDRLAMKKDADGLISLYRRYSASNFAYVDRSGKRSNRAEMEGRMRSQMGMIDRFQRQQTTIRRIQVTGKTAVVTAEMSYSLLLKGDPKQPMTVAGTSVHRDTWVLTERGWRLQEMRLVTEKSTLNGRPINTTGG